MCQDGTSHTGANARNGGSGAAGEDRPGQTSAAIEYDWQTVGGHCEATTNDNS